MNKSVHHGIYMPATNNKTKGKKGGRAIFHTMYKHEFLMGKKKPQGLKFVRRIYQRKS